MPDHTPIARRRLAMLNNGWRPICVHGPNSPYAHSPGKQPAARWGNTPAEKNWRLGHTPEQLANVGLYTANTGILCDGLRVFDLDIDDAKVAESVQALLRPRIPATAVLTRCRKTSSRIALIARAAEGEPGKLAVEGQHGKGEVLGRGQQVLVHGVHPDGDRWDFRGSAPWEMRLADLPGLPETTVVAALEEIRASGLLGDTVVHTGGGGAFVSERDRLYAIKREHLGDIGRIADEMLAEAVEGNRHNTLVTVAGFLIARAWPPGRAERLLWKFASDWDGHDWEYHVEKAVAHAHEQQRKKRGGLKLPTRR